ncbi:hypothetical protein M3650_17060 [Paenibacillus sp. MER TA 81-3]|uniref:hypothetical protein n=1 Tax=Paenibacillus sp. MER TA 81-3 TaxID=2939573 RepID=UPI00203E5FDB|nr:hypothetical protein [Paenibacillus sp. MER TA 81-3]MCM3340307.1 hypothetical protein [Paenibacillus sp. MER TA 81-3]
MSESNPKWVNDLKKVHDQLAIDESFKAELRCKLVQEGLTFEQTSRRNRDNDGSRSEGGPHIQAGAGAEHSSMMILDGNGERAVMDVTREDNRADIAILSIDGADMAPVYLYDKLQGPNYEEMGTRLWDGSMLSFYIAVDGRDFFFKYNAAQ